MQAETEETIKKKRELMNKTREISFNIIYDVLENKEFSHIVLNRELFKYPEMDIRDRNFIKRLTSGTIEYSILIDYIINKYSKIKVRKQKPLIRNILRMSVYQILFLDIPDRAAINEAVDFVKDHNILGLAGFVNAVLRKISREQDLIKSGIEGSLKSGNYPLYIRYSIPEFLYNYFILNYGKKKTKSFLEFFLSEDKPNFIRTKDGETLEFHGNILDDNRFKEGLIAVQDYTSQQVARLINPEKGEYIVDLCSAPGGKCCHLAELLKGTGHVDARDLSDEKVALVEENIKRLRLKNISVKARDAECFDKSLIDENGNGIADTVLCDLPCSGLGIIGRKPDIKLRLRLQDFKDLQALQRKILKNAIRYVKPGGKLMYSTCTLSREENEENREYISKELGLTLVEEKKFLPGDPSDGFYMALFRKQDNK